MRERHAWFLFMLAALLMLIALSFHMILMHMGGLLAWFGRAVGEPTSWSSTMSRSKGVLWPLFYFVFLTAAVWHGFYGLRGIVLELTRAKRAVTWTVGVVGFLVWALGAWTILKLAVGG